MRTPAHSPVSRTAVTDGRGVHASRSLLFGGESTLATEKRHEEPGRAIPHCARRTRKFGKTRVGTRSASSPRCDRSRLARSPIHIQLPAGIKRSPAASGASVARSRSSSHRRLHGRASADCPWSRTTSRPGGRSRPVRSATSTSTSPRRSRPKTKGISPSRSTTSGVRLRRGYQEGEPRRSVEPERRCSCIQPRNVGSAP